MKKTFLLLPLFAGIAYFTLSSNAGGYAGNKSGSDTSMAGAQVGCGGSTCHGTSASTSTTVTVLLDSAGTYVTRYKAGKTYRIKIVGANTSTTETLPKFGFQVSVVKASSYSTQAGNFSGTPPTSTNVVPYTGISVWGHTAAISNSVGTGGIGSVDSLSHFWVAPTTAGFGAVKIFVAMNMVDGNGLASTGDKWNTNSVTINEITTSGVPEIAHGVTVKAFPNPVTSGLNVELNNAVSGTYHVSLFDLNGKLMNTQAVEMNGNSTSVNINVSNYVSGIYQVVVEKDGVSTTTPVFKN